MNISILQGPNLNLIGLVSSRLVDQRITLEKINKRVRSFSRQKDLNIKILQTNSVDKAITFLQRNRKWTDAFIIAPSSWCNYENSLKSTLEIIAKPVIEVFLSPPFEEFGTSNQSLLSTVCSTTITNSPETAFCDAVDYILKKYL